jgi:hypothetical protein
MSDDRPKLADVDPAARVLVATVRTVIDQVMRSVMQMQMCATEAEADRYAHAVLDEMTAAQLPALVAAHDILAAALNTASPGEPPILSLTTERPA